MNSSFDEEIIKDDKRAIIWVPDGDIKLRPKTLTEADIDFLLDGDNLFARKFDEQTDGAILDILETALDAELLAKHSKSTNSIPMKIAYTKKGIYWSRKR